MHLVTSLASQASQVMAIIESSSVFPKKLDAYKHWSSMRKHYMQQVWDTEKEIFGEVKFLPSNVCTFPVQKGDVTNLEDHLPSSFWEADLFVVFGSSYLRGSLCEKLIERRAINIHIGVSPFYRGAACNFWALFDKRPEYVGATIHLLSQGLDSGDILYHVFPEFVKPDPFYYTMDAVRAAHYSLISKIKSEEILKLEGRAQDKSIELRYSRLADFTNDVIERYRKYDDFSRSLREGLARRDKNLFIRPVVC